MAEKPTEEELKEAFDEYDLNGDGKITTKEVRKAMKKLFGEKLSKKDARDYIDGADDDGDGTVDFEEFCRKMISSCEEEK